MIVKEHQELAKAGRRRRHSAERIQQAIEKRIGESEEMQCQQY
jgi:hypothetical protein